MDWKASIEQITPKEINKEASVEEPILASFYERLAAWGIDIIPFLIPFVVFNNANGADYFYILMFKLFIFSISYSIYYIAMEYYFGATIGKYLVGLKVVDTNHNPPSISSLIARFLSSIVSWSLFNIGHLKILSKDRLSLHDIMSKTRVIHYDSSIFSLPPIPKHINKVIALTSIVIQLALLIGFWNFHLTSN